MKQARTALKDARTKRGLTQEQVANKLQIKVRSYQRYEAGERTPSLKMCVQLEALFGITIKKLLVQDSTPESAVR